MTQISQPWNGTSVGDATRAKYSAAEWAEMYRHFFGLGDNRGVFFPAGITVGVNAGSLEFSSPAANTARIGPGAAMVHGYWYYNDDDVDINVPSASSGSWREDCIVVRADEVAQEARLARRENTTGENTAWDNSMLTQVDGDTWEIPIVAVTVDDAGNVSSDRYTTWDTKYILNPYMGITEVLGANAAQVAGFASHDVGPYDPANGSNPYHPVIVFPAGADSAASWNTTIRKWSGDTDIRVQTNMWNDDDGSPGDTTNSARWLLKATQYPRATTTVYRAAFEEQAQNLGPYGDNHAVNTGWYLDHNEFEPYDPITITVARNGTGDSNTDDWILLWVQLDYTA